MAERKSLLLSLGMLMISLGIYVVVLFFPLAYAVLLILLIPLSTYAILRLKWLGASIHACALITVMSITRNIFSAAFVAVHVVSVLALCLAMRKKNYDNFIVAALGSMLGMVFAVCIICMIGQATPMESIANLTKTSTSKHVIAFARSYEVEYRFANSEHALDQAEYVKNQIKIEIDALTDEQVLQEFSEHLRLNLYEHFLEYVLFPIPLIAGVGIWLTSLLTRAFQQSWNKETKKRWHALLSLRNYPTEKLNEWCAPKGYLLAVFVPTILVYVIALGTNNELLMGVYRAVNLMLVMIPFAFCGASLIAYLFTNKSMKMLPLAMLLIGVLVVIFPVLSIIGIVDHLLHIRKIMKIIDDPIDK